MSDFERNRPQALDRESFFAATRVSRETMTDLAVYESLLLKWQKRINLVSAKSLSDLWRRHMLDSFQLTERAPARARRWVDLGSGGGFPGLVVAILLKDRPGMTVHLIDSDTRKCAFLRHVALETGAPVTVHRARIEDLGPTDFGGPADIVSARACAPLPSLLALAAPFFADSTVGLFLKGQHVEEELTAARKCWTLETVVHPSVSDPAGCVLEVKHPVLQRSE